MDQARWELPPSQETLDADWVASRVEDMFGRFKKDDWVNPHEAFRTIVLNLVRFPLAVVEAVTDPVTGIHTRQQWSPTIADIMRACQKELEHQTVVARARELPPPIPRLQAPARPVKESFEAMFAKHGRPYGPFEPGRMLPYEA